MANYIHDSVNAHVTPSWPNTTAYDKQMITSGPTGAQVSFTLDEADVGPDQIQTGSAITAAGRPNSDAWENAGTWSLDLEVNVGNMNTRARIRAVMLTSTGTIREQGTFGSFVTTDAGSMNLTCTAPTWAPTEVCSDLAAIEVEHENTDTHSSRSLTLDLGENAGAGLNDAVTSVTEDQGTCAPAAGVNMLTILGAGGS